MKEHPIIFSTDMVKAILDGRKTMTRRVIKKPPLLLPEKPIPELIELRKELALRWCPYGQVGDRLWVRETWAVGSQFNNDKPSGIPHNPHKYYLADYPQGVSGIGKWRPSIFMPRWASRITLEITELRVERLQEITFQDCLAEGVMGLSEEKFAKFNEDWQPPKPDNKTPEDELADDLESEMRHVFMKLWDSLNAKRGYGWDTNPWVWVIGFKEKMPKVT